LGRLEQPKEQQPLTMTFRFVPYTGGDPKKFGELGKILDIPVLDPKYSHLSSSSSQLSTWPARSIPNSSLVGKNIIGLDTFSRKSTRSGPMVLQPTGLTTF